MIGLTVALLGGAGRGERRPGDLETRIDTYRAVEGSSPAERLRGDVRALEEKIAVLADLKANPEFDAPLIPWIRNRSAASGPMTTPALHRCPRASRVG